MTQQGATFQRATVAEAAVVLNVSTTTVRRMLKRGQLEGERVLRPQGSAFLVTLPDDSPHAAGDAAPTRQGRGRVARSNAAGTQQREKNPVSDSSPAGQLAAWSETFLLPLVATIERQAARLEDLARENGRLSAENAALQAQNGTLEPSESMEDANPYPGAAAPLWAARGGCRPGARRQLGGAASVAALMLHVAVLGWWRRWLGAIYG